MIIVDDNCCRNCGQLWTIMSFCGLTWTLKGCFSLLYMCNMTWTRNLRQQGFPKIIFNQSNRFQKFLLKEPWKLQGLVGSVSWFGITSLEESKSPNSQHIFGPKNSPPFHCPQVRPQVLGMGNVPLGHRVLWSAALNPLKNHGSGVFFGGGASGWGPWEILNFDSTKKRTRCEESEMVGTCLNRFLFCSVFFFSAGFQNLHVFNLETWEVSDNFLKRRQ